MVAPLLSALLLLGGPTPQAATVLKEVVADIRVHGNVLTPDEEVRRLAGVEIGIAVTPALVDEVGARLRGTHRFVRVEVLKRFASIEDLTRVVIVIVVDEGPVKIEALEDIGKPPTVARRGGLGLMYLPLLSYEDGYGFTYGVQMARPDVAGRRSRLSIPLTWGGDKRAAVSLEKSFEGGALTRVEGGASVSRRENPFFDLDDDRGRVWLRAERAIGPSLNVGGTAGWQHVSFDNGSDHFTDVGVDLTFDTRLDPWLARNAVFARAEVEHLDFGVTPSLNRTELEARGYIGLVGQTILVIGALRQDADLAQPAYLQPLLGGMANLRGFEAGTAIGDTLVAGSIEVRVPLTSPLSVGKLGVSAFVDAGTVYNDGARLSDQTFSRGVGGAVWFTAAFLRLNLAVAHGIGASTHVHFGTSVRF